MGDELADLGLELGLLDAEVSAHDLLLELEAVDLGGESAQVDLDRVHLQVPYERLPAREPEVLPERVRPRQLPLKQPAETVHALDLTLDLPLSNDLRDTRVMADPRLHLLSG